MGDWGFVPSPIRPLRRIGRPLSGGIALRVRKRSVNPRARARRQPRALQNAPGCVHTRPMPVCPACGTDNPEIAKFCLACGSQLQAAPPPQEFRKIVTIVFSDLKGSTAMGERLDSESLREVMTRYFDAMSAELERHGGVVEKFIGDAIMAVFGLPKLHEDDALRAVRAAADMQRAQAKLNDELERKGKSRPVPAYRLVRVHDDAERPRRLDSPIVGRVDELARLQASLAEVVAERRCRLVTVVGAAGVGKSRLIDEFVRSLDTDAAFLRGRCLAYGDGITFWPLAEAVRQAAGILERDSTEVALQKLSALSGDAQAEERVASAIGLVQTHFPGEELAWGARKLLEALSRPGPLVVLFEDVHWAEPTFLQLVEHVVEAAEDASLLIVCTTRHDLVERRPQW